MARREENAAARPRADRPGWLSRIVQNNRRALATAAGRLRRRPVGTLLTAFVIGITLALPAGLQALIGELDASRDDWEGAFEASLFLKDSVTEERGRALSGEIGNQAGVMKVRYISRDEALAEFRASSDYGEALDLLKENPLPAVIVVTPDRSQPGPAADALIRALGQRPEVDQVRYDQKWLQRFYAAAALVERLVDAIALLLAAAVVMVVGNTLRLDVQENREEILVMKQVGASDSFIRRPFLLTGMLYGLFGGIAASIMTLTALQVLAEPTRQLLQLYGSQHQPGGLDPALAGAVVFGGILLGWMGSVLSLRGELRAIEPR